MSRPLRLANRLCNAMRSDFSSLISSSVASSDGLRSSALMRLRSASTSLRSDLRSLTTSVRRLRMRSRSESSESAPCRKRLR